MRGKHSWVAPVRLESNTARASAVYMPNMPPTVAAAIQVLSCKEKEGRRKWRPMMIKFPVRLADYNPRFVREGVRSEVCSKLAIVLINYFLFQNMLLTAYSSTVVFPM